MRTSDLDYPLPPHMIATRPAEPRDHSRLLVYRRATGSVEHRRFFDLPEYLRAGDLLVVNDTRVIPAKLVLRRETGGVVSGLFVAEERAGVWKVLLKTRGRVRTGAILRAGDYVLRLVERMVEKGMWRAELTPPTGAAEALRQIGHVPLPPYIAQERRHLNQAAEQPDDPRQYQTVYGNPRYERSLAAPTAGLHFTSELLARIEAAGVRRAAVELDVGLGTFLPVETTDFESHPMHAEAFRIAASTVEALRLTRGQRAGRIVVVGTTAVRALESNAAAILDASGPATELRGTTDLKIAPGFAFRLTDVLVTNFHLPRSTLMALVAALVGLEKIKELYALAVREKYRFYSYGDAMLILP